MGRWIKFDIFFLVLLLIGYPIVGSIRVLFNINDNILSLVYRALYVIMALPILFRRRRSQNVSPLAYKAILAFFIVYSIRLVYDLLYREIPTYGNHDFSYFFFYAVFASFIPCLAVANIVIRPEDLPLLNRGLYYGFSIVGGVMLYAVSSQSGTGINQLLSQRTAVQDEEGQNVVSGLLLSVYGSGLALLSFTYLFVSNGILKKASTLITFVIGAALLLLGASRLPVITLLLGIAIQSYKSRRSSKAHSLLLVIILMCGGLFVVLSANLEQLALFQRLQALQDESGLIRLKIWESALTDFVDHPFLGSQMFERRIVFQYPHNIIIEIFMATGMAGGVFFIIYLYKVLRYFFKKLNYSAWLPVCIIFLNFFLFGLSSGAIYTSVQFWCLSMLVLINPQIGTKRKTRSNAFPQLHEVNQRLASSQNAP